MKRCRALLCALFALALCLPCAAAGYGLVAEYEVPELYLSLDLPLDWSVLTRDAEAGNPALFLYDDDPEYMRSVFEASDIYLDAFNFESLLELTILMTPDEDIFDLSLWDEEFVSEAAEYYAENPVWAGENDVQCFRVDDHYQSGARFLTYNRLETQDGVQLRCIQMTTVFNGQTIHLILTDYSGALSFDTGSLGAVMLDVMSGLRFTDVLTAPDGGGEDVLLPDEIPYEYEYSGEIYLDLVSILAGLMPALAAAVFIIALVKGRRRAPARATPMRRVGNPPPPAPEKPAAGDPGRPVQMISLRRPKHNCAEQDPSFAPKRRSPRREEAVFCIDCGKKVSVKDDRCPHCGARVV